MLKTVSSITNAIGALNYKGTWNANTNTPTLASGVGTKGDYYVVSVAGTTTLDGISNWGIGDWAVFNGSAWQRVEGGADLNGVNLSVSGTSTLGGNATFKDNLTQGTAGKGVNFTANTPAAGMTSQLLNWYEEGTWTPTISGSTTAGTGTYSAQVGSYTRIGRQVTVYGRVVQTNNTGTGNIRISNLPFALATDYACGSIYASGLALTAGYYPVIFMSGAGSTYININQVATGTGADATVPMDTACDLIFSITYFV